MSALFRNSFSHLIKQVEFNLSGDGMLIVAGNSQARVYDREGKKVLECVKGDPYIVDMAKTKVNIFQTCAAQKAQRFMSLGLGFQPFGYLGFGYFAISNKIILNIGKHEYSHHFFFELL